MTDEARVEPDAEDAIDVRPGPDEWEARLEAKRRFLDLLIDLETKLIDSKTPEHLQEGLKEFEGPALCALAGVNAKLGLTAPDRTPLQDRQQLLGRLLDERNGRQHISAEQLITYARDRALPGHRARYNLACFYAEQHARADYEITLPSSEADHLRSDMKEACFQLQLALEEGDEPGMATWALKDPTLEPLRRDRNLGADVFALLWKAGADASELSNLEAIGSSAGAQLASADVMDASALIHGCEDEEGRRRIERRLGADNAQHLTAWLAVAHLIARLDLSPEEANLLWAAGVRSLDELSTRHSDSLTQLLTGINVDRKDLKDPPPKAQVIAWIWLATHPEPADAEPVAVAPATDPPPGHPSSSSG